MLASAFSRKELNTYVFVAEGDTPVKTHTYRVARRYALNYGAGDVAPMKKKVIRRAILILMVWRTALLCAPTVS